MRILIPDPSRKRQALRDVDRAFKILRLVAAHFSLSIDDLEGHSRPWKFVWPRWCAVVLIKRHTQLGSYRLGIIMNRDHAAIEHAISTHKDRLETNHADADAFASLEHLVKAALGSEISQTPNHQPKERSLC